MLVGPISTFCDEYGGWGRAVIMTVDSGRLDSSEFMFFMFGEGWGF